MNKVDILIPKNQVLEILYYVAINITKHKYVLTETYMVDKESRNIAQNKQNPTNYITKDHIATHTIFFKFKTAFSLVLTVLNNIIITDNPESFIYSQSQLFHWKP